LSNEIECLHIYILCAIILSLAFLEVQFQKNLRGVRLARGVDPICLVFADDCIVFIQETNEMQAYILKIQEWFWNSSSCRGGIIIDNKSEVFLNSNTPKQYKDCVLALKMKKAEISVRLTLMVIHSSLIWHK
jgi:hypothetical protein